MTSRPRLASKLRYAASRIVDFSLGRSNELGPQAIGRLGQATVARPAGCLLWLHAPSAPMAGAITALTQELSQLRGVDVHALVTTTDDVPLTPSVAETTIHQAAPGETPGSVTRFIQHWQPDFCVYVGPPDRPLLIKATADADIPLYAAAAERGTLDDYRRIAYLSKNLLAKFACFFAASAAEAEVLEKHLEGEDLTLEITGPLSDTTHALPCSDEDCDALVDVLGGRPVWLAAQISMNELEAMEQAHRKAFRAAHRLLLIVSPRDFDEAPEMARKLENAGWRTARRSADTYPGKDVQIFIADVPDELGLWYRLSPTTFVGGTFDAGALPSDPFHPAALGSAVLHGPETGIATARFDVLDRSNASIHVTDAEELGQNVQALLAPDKAASLAQAGWAATTESAHVVERLAELMDLHLDEQDL